MAEIPDVTIKVEMTELLKERLDRIENMLNIMLNRLPQNVTVDIRMDGDKMKVGQLVSGLTIKEDEAYWKKYPGTRGTTPWVRDEDGDSYEVIDEE